jgi:hypothetical protein
MTSSVLHRDLQGTAETYCFLLAAYPTLGVVVLVPSRMSRDCAFQLVSKANPTRSKGEKVSAKVPELPHFQSTDASPQHRRTK